MVNGSQMARTPENICEPNELLKLDEKEFWFVLVEEKVVLDEEPLLLVVMAPSVPIWLMKPAFPEVVTLTVALLALVLHDALCVTDEGYGRVRPCSRRR